MNKELILELLNKGMTDRQIAEIVTPGKTRQNMTQYIARNYKKKTTWKLLQTK